ncbi:hypothetical protein C2G38_2234072 [Gigaspora rosea]|uniref:Uncharacterized protein n=1 Tax=Gigaspora rosea TaxID=44941 RepID=A0A397TUD1_9GLOM|nr:hypothetical protein C2G38_2234072 [Gigaspora rosea]
MQFSGHRSANGLRTYKNPNDQQRLKNSTLLLNAIQESPIVQQEPHQESQVIQELQQESQVIQHEDFQITEHEVQVTQDEEFQNTQQVTQDNSSIMQEFNTTFTQVKSQVSHKNIHKKKPKLIYKEVQAKLNKPFRIPFKDVQDQTQFVETANNTQQIKTTKDTQPIEMTKNTQHIKTTKDTQPIEMTKNTQHIKPTKDTQCIENNEMTKDGTTNIFKFHNSGDVKIIFSNK